MKLSDYEGNKPVFTTIHVAKNNAAVTYFSVDEEGDFQAFSEHESKIEETMLISLSELLRIEPTLKIITDLHPGAEYHKDLISSEWLKS